jgi:hypothetical protein
METVVAPVTSHCSIEEWPTVTTLGLAIKFTTAGFPAAGVTAMVVEAITEPALLVAVKVYLAVSAGDTDFVPDNGTVPIPLSMETEVAPVTSHCRLEELPAVIAFGIAEKCSIAGTPAAELTITVADEVDEPYRFVAVRV